MTNVTIGIDLGDKIHEVCVLNMDGEIVERFSVKNTKKQLQKEFKRFLAPVIAIETGTHSPWISRILTAMGARVLVGNARKLRAIWSSSQKTDVRDAEMLARLARFDEKLLYPIHHRCEQAQVDLEMIKARDIMVSVRTKLINHVRCVVKSLGERLPACSAECFHKRAEVSMPDKLRATQTPLVEQIALLTQKIRAYDKQIEQLAKVSYPETACLRQIQGVGVLTSLTFILTLESSDRFATSRSVGPYLGLIPRHDQSGETDNHMRITKEGDVFLRRLLVSCGQYILGRFGQDCDLRRYGLRLAARGGKVAKRKAVVAVARKLSVLLHRLWSTGEIYQPLYNAKKVA
jgi:transposase